MRIALIFITLGILLTIPGCTKFSHTSTTVHTQKYSTFNFIFDGTAYNNSLKDSLSSVWTTSNISNIYMGGVPVPVRELNISFYNNRYSLNLVGRKFSVGSPTGIYKIGEGIDSATHYPFTYGQATITGFNNRENNYSSVTDTNSSYITVTEAELHKVKGWFVLKCEDYSHNVSHTVTGDFDIIIP
ncbi:hypothetical protein CJD36_003780 [Flavipsychrobacter stenotrophus]|uniref:Uncharacterized protein n=1 Tax=Flavipsychrobacter stenotrophus TaxID=2077091 RepID=A0A2S7T257_9BACT|nr:hypothetical protein [Flavipsychrobacter stenotrophus]PQJ12875.1 hypothetical protein CJD36_003780 [Flavipsychrobacter stenotrophus]